MESVITYSDCGKQPREEQTHPVRSHEVKMNEKMESLNIQTDYETSKNEQIKKTDLLFVFCKCV